jgi:hypothetical protein
VPFGSDRVSGGAHHGEIAERVQSEHADLGEISGCGDRASNRSRNIVEFQVEEDAGREVCQSLDGSRSFGGKQLAAYFE